MGGLLAVALARNPSTSRPSATLGRECLLLFLASLTYFAWGLAQSGRAFLEYGTVWAAPTVFALNVLFVGMVGLILRYAGYPLLFILRWRWLVYLGQISYGLYLYHFIVINIIRHSSLLDSYATRTWASVGAFSATVVLAALSWKYIERPILSLKERVASYRQVRGMRKEMQPGLLQTQA